MKSRRLALFALLALVVSTGCRGRFRHWGRRRAVPVITAVFVEPPHARVAEVAVPPAVALALAAPDRTAADRALDSGRHPDQTLAFFGVQAGQRIGELFAGGGYTTELLARVVGPTGQVYGENSPFILQRFAEAPWSQRLATPPMARVVRIDRDLDAPFPPDVRDLDAVLFVLSYHDAVWMHVDRDAMNRAVFAALRPGGIYGIVDHSAVQGHGLRDVQTFHRIDRTTLIAEVLRAGFRLDAEADFLRNPSDARDWNDSPRAAGDRRGTSDRFVLRFVKP